MALALLARLVGDHRQRGYAPISEQHLHERARLDD